MLYQWVLCLDIGDKVSEEEYREGEQHTHRSSVAIRTLRELDGGGARVINPGFDSFEHSLSASRISLFASAY